MSTQRCNGYQRPEAHFSEDGCTVLVTLRLDRRKYEFARFWAGLHAEGFPAVTAEDELEGYLSMALLRHMQDTGFIAPPEIEALYPKPSSPDPGNMEDEIPF